MAAPFEEFFSGIPIVTRCYMTACGLTTLAVWLDVVNPLALYLNFPLVWHKMEVWRLFTNFIFIDYFGLNFLFNMFFFVRHSRLLEETSFRGRTADYVFMWMFGASLLLLVDLGFYFVPGVQRIMFLAPSLAFMVVYVWSRHNPRVRLSFLGLMTFNAPYLTWVILGFGWLLGQSPVLDLLGIFVGHIYYFCEDVFPHTPGGFRILRTPTLLKHLLDAPPGPRVEMRPGGNPWGEGQVLGDAAAGAPARGLND